MTSADERARLREIAQAATPGEWAVHRPWLHFGQMGVQGVIPRANLHPEEPYQVKSEHNHGSASYALHVAVPAHGHSCDDKSDAARNMEHIAAFSPATALRLLAQLERQEKALEVAGEALTELQLGHEHNTNEGDHYRPLGDTYGWCHICSTKVGLNEDVVREALARIKEILG